MSEPALATSPDTNSTKKSGSERGPGRPPKVSLTPRQLMTAAVVSSMDLPNVIDEEGNLSRQTGHMAPRYAKAVEFWVDVFMRVAE